jgi:hypothetical protein
MIKALYGFRGYHQLRIVIYEDSDYYAFSGDV